MFILNTDWWDGIGPWLYYFSFNHLFLGTWQHMLSYKKQNKHDLKKRNFNI